MNLEPGPAKSIASIVTWYFGQKTPTGRAALLLVVEAVPHVGVDEVGAP